jgi:hypothetical protein
MSMRFVSIKAENPRQLCPPDSSEWSANITGAVPSVPTITERFYLFRNAVQRFGTSSSTEMPAVLNFDESEG